ncbi:TetR/AcrR family transcriptional regulator [Mycobacterium sp.]|uniref:TetR/AcrR family transcriptional regulator n=1 Tax=Mycobacterium sp. TaxID=1785 RepID=UPI003A8BE572
MTKSWLVDDASEAATERILDAAEELYAAHGLNGISMDAVARAAGCSRATLYRYFDNRKALQFAFAHREALRIVEVVGNRLQSIEDPHERAVEAVVGAIEQVRAKPALHAWVTPGEAGQVSEVLRESPLIESFTARFVGGRDDLPDLDLARWVLRCIVSFLAVPGPDTASERRLIERFLAPHLTVR